MRLARPTALLAVVLLCGCPDKKSDGHVEEQTLIKLQQAKEAGALAGKPPDENGREKLAELAAAGKTDEGGPRPLPRDNATVFVGPIAVKLVKLDAGPMVSSGKITLSTEDSFLVVRLVAQNTGDKDAPLDLQSATITSKSGELGLARDAQRLAGTRDLEQTLSGGKDAPRADLTLIFELPKDAIGTGLALNLHAPDGHVVKIPLE